MNQLCIPMIESVIKKDYIKKTLIKLNWGVITKIIEIPSRTDKSYKRVIINIIWNDSNVVNPIKTRLSEGDVMYIVPEKMSPFFWQIKESKHNF